MTEGSQNKERWTAEDLRHLLQRTSFAVDEQQVARLITKSREETVDLLLSDSRRAPPPMPPQWVKTPWVNTERRSKETTSDEFRAMHRSTNARYFKETADLRRWWLAEMLTTTVPLREVMTLFWHGHFTSSIGKVLVSQAMYQQNAAQRRFALGNFQEFLKVMTLDPAMLIYLDLEDSEGRRPNENYARELYELFTLGHGNYTQQDIMETARALSGWCLTSDLESPELEQEPDVNRRFTREGLFPRLIPERHDGGQKVLFGMSGNFGLDEVIALTVNHPACGRFLAGKLLSFFAVFDPTEVVREQMASAFRATHGELAPMLRVMLMSNEFYLPESRLRLIKSPLALFVGACRQLNVEVTVTPALNRYLAALGQEPFNPPNVKGWPGNDAWIGAGTLALRYHLPDVILDSQEPPGMDPIGRGRGRPIPLPKDAADRAAMLQSMMIEPRSGESNEMSEMEGRRGRSSGPAIQTRFVSKALFPDGIPDAADQVVDRVFNRMLNAPFRSVLRDAAVETATRHQGEDRVRAVIRLVLSSPDYQLA